jgi:hypothetical protein
LGFTRRFRAPTPANLLGIGQRFRFQFPLIRCDELGRGATGAANGHLGASMDQRIEMNLALAAFEDALQSARSQLGIDERGAAMSALLAVIAFIDSFPDWNGRSLSLPFQKLLMAFADLNNGRTDAMLTPTAVCNRKPDASARQLVKGYAAYCVDVLMLSGDSNQEGCEFVASKLARLGYKIEQRIEGRAWRTVKTWRDRLSKLPETDQTRRVYEGLRAELGSPTFESLGDARTYISERLEGLARVFPGV